MAAHALHRPAWLTRGLLALLLATTAFAFPVAARASTTCDGGADKCPDATSNGKSYKAVISIPGYKSGGTGNGSGGGGSSCAGCDWALVVACSGNRVEDGLDALCGPAVYSCPSRGLEGVLFWVYRRPPGGYWDYVGSTCIGPRDRVLTVADVVVDARRYVQELTPTTADFRVAQSRVVVNQRTFFEASGADGPISGTFGPQEMRMTVTATPTYVWDFGDGSEPFETTSPGGPYPDGDVTHVYTRSGVRHVTLTTRWAATFTVTTELGTFGPLPVPGPPIAPTTTHDVRVQEARAETVANAPR